MSGSEEMDARESGWGKDWGQIMVVDKSMELVGRGNGWVEISW